MTFPLTVQQLRGYADQIRADDQLCGYWYQLKDRRYAAGSDELKAYRSWLADEVERCAAILDAGEEPFTWFLPLSPTFFLFRGMAIDMVELPRRTQSLGITPAAHTVNVGMQLINQALRSLYDGETVYKTLSMQIGVFKIHDHLPFPENPYGRRPKAISLGENDTAVRLVCSRKELA